MARGGCGDCPEESPILQARRHYDALIQRWTAAQAEVIAEAGRSASLPVELARRVAAEREIRGEVLEAQEALQRLLFGRR